MGSEREGVLDARAPQLDDEMAARLAREAFGLSVDALRPLGSERDRNFWLRSDGRELVLKVSNPAEEPAVLDFQLRALAHAAERDPTLPIPRAIPTRTGALTSELLGSDGRRSLVHLLTYLPGVPLATLTPGPALAREVGRSAARLGCALRGFFHPAAGRALLWDLKQAATLRPRSGEITDPARRALAESWLQRFEEVAWPVLPGLRAQVIHNDMSLSNTLIDPASGRVSGIIDFGDMLHAPLVDDVAVALAELLLVSQDPHATALALVGGYEEIEPLREAELALLCELTGARLAMGLVISAWRVKQHPENAEYITADDDALAPALERLAGIEHELRGALLAKNAPAPVVPQSAPLRD